MLRIKTVAKLNDRKAAMNFIGILFILNFPHSIENIARYNPVD